MRFAVFIASHICYNNQINLLEKAILSVKKQTYKDIEIWLSISFSSEEYENNFDLTNIPNDCFKCFKHPKQMYQLEHLSYLNEMSYKLHSYDWICFLDDDDEYSEGRIKAFQKKAVNIKNTDIKLYAYTMIIYEKGLCKSSLNEKIINCLIYWLYAVKPDALNVFFKIFSPSHFKNLNADFILKMYFERLFNMNDGATIKNGYYLYNTNNNNSITNINNSKEDDDESDIIYFFTCMNAKKELIKRLGPTYKKHIDNKLYEDCRDNLYISFKKDPVKNSLDWFNNIVFKNIKKYRLEKAEK